MNKRKVLIAVFLLGIGANLLGEEAGEAKEKKPWSFKTGINHTERQQGRISSRVYNEGYIGADDFNEDGDVTSVFTSLGYKFNDKWSMDYKYSFDHVNNNEQFGRNSDKDSGQYRTHTVRLIRNFEEFNLAGKEWDSSIWVGGSHYVEPSIQGQDADGEQEYKYNGNTQKRILFNANINTSLTDKTHLDLNYKYQFRDYDYDNGAKEDVNQHRHYISVGVDHNFNDSWYINTDNTLYLRQKVGETQNYGEWDYNYTLGHKYPIGNGYILNTELTAWGEVSLWEKGATQVQDSNQGEIVFMPKIKREFKLSEDSNISGFLGAGYVHGYDTRTTRKMYSGFEGRAGAVYSHNF